MKPLSKTQSIIYLLGGALMVIGAGCFVVMWQQKVFCWVFLLGALMFSAMQASQIYEGNDLTLKRLKRLQALANLAFMLAGMLMVDSAYGYLQVLFGQGAQAYYNYLQYVYNKWVVLLLIAALLEIYTAHRIDYEIKKQDKAKG